MMKWAVVLVAFLLAIPTAHAQAGFDKKRKGDAGKLKVAVMDLKGADKVAKELVAALTALIPQTLDELGPFKAISKQDIEQMLAVERMKDAVGCSDSSCLAEIGGALGADYIVTGSVVLVGDTYVEQLQLLNIRTARAEQRVSREYKGQPQGLFDETRAATRLLVRDLLSQKSGALALKTNEEGATVRVDGSIVGVTPLPALSVSGGAHTIGIEKEGFVRHNQDIQIQEAKTTPLEVNLLPSEEFKKAYVAKATLYRALAWTFTAVGVAAIGGGVAALVIGMGESNKLQSDMTAYNAKSTRDQAEYDRLRSRQSGLGTYDALTVAGFAAGAALVATGVAFFVVGDSPSKYDNVTSSVSVAVLAAPNQIGLHLAF